MDLSLSVRRDGHGTTVEVGGEIDLGSGPELLEFALDVMREQGPWLAVDLAGVTFMDCGGVRVLLAIRSRARREGGHLNVVAISPPVHRVLRIIGMDTLLAPMPHRGRDWAGHRRPLATPPGAADPAPPVPPALVTDQEDRWRRA